MRPLVIKRSIVNLTGLPVVISFGPYKQKLPCGGKVDMILNDPTWLKQFVLEGVGQFPDGTRVIRQEMPEPKEGITMCLGYGRTFFDNTHTPVSHLEEFTEVMDVRYAPLSSEYLNERVKMFPEEIQLEYVQFAPTPTGEYIPPKVAYNKTDVSGNVFTSPNNNTHKPLLFLGLFSMNNSSSKQVSKYNTWVAVAILFIIMFILIAVISVVTYRYYLHKKDTYMLYQ
jgi:hypothetical protein